MESKCAMCGATKEGCKNFYCSTNPKHVPKEKAEKPKQGAGHTTGMSPLDKMKQRYCGV